MLDAPEESATALDAGIGSQDLDHIFDRFYRSAEARAVPGSGLGLAIVRQVAAAHGGAVRAEAADGGGTCFVVTLPATYSDEKAATTLRTPSMPANAGGQRSGRS